MVGSPLLTEHALANHALAANGNNDGAEAQGETRTPSTLELETQYIAQRSRRYRGRRVVVQW